MCTDVTNSITISSPSGLILFRGNVCFSSDGSMKGYGKGHRSQGYCGEGDDKWVPEFLIGAWNKDDYALYLLANEAPEQNYSYDPYGHEGKLYDNLLGHWLVIDADPNGSYFGKDPDRVKVQFGRQDNEFGDPIDGFKQLKRDVCNNKIFAENGVKYCKRMLGLRAGKGGKK